MVYSSLIWCLFVCNVIMILSAVIISKIGRKFINSLYLYYKNKTRFPERYKSTPKPVEKSCLNCAWMINKKSIEDSYCHIHYFFPHNNGNSCSNWSKSLK